MFIQCYSLDLRMLFRTFFFSAIFYILLGSQSAQAQTPSLKHFDVGTGLPSNEIFDLKIDSKGFLWVGTSEGLVRYDGNSFFLLNNPKSRGNAVTGILEDKAGTIWFHNFNGQIFHTSSDSALRFLPWEPFYKNQLTEFTFDQQGQLVVNNNLNHIYRFNLTKNSVAKLLEASSIKEAIATMHDGSILFSQVDQGFVSELREQSTTKVPFIGENGVWLNEFKILNQFRFYTSFKKQQTLAFQRRNPTDAKPYLFSYQNHALHVHPVTAWLQQKKLFPLSAFDDDEGNLFIGTENGLIWFKQQNGKYIWMNHFLKSEAISAINKGKEGGYWIATLKNGVYQIPNLQLYASNGIEMGLKTEGVSHLAIDRKRGKIYAASLGGELFEYQHQLAKQKLFQQQYERNIQVIEFDTASNELYLSKLTTEKLNPQTGKFTEIKFAASAKDYLFRKDGVIFYSGSLLIASFPQNRKDLFEKIVKEFHLDAGIMEKETGGGFYNLNLNQQRNRGLWYQEKEQRLWVGFVDGLQYHQKGNWVKLKDPQTGEPISAHHFTALPDGTICIATVDQGLYFFNNGQFKKHLTVKDGLLNNKIKGLTSDQYHIWMVMPNGAQGYEIATGKLTKIVIASDLPKQEIFDVEIWKDTVYLATSKGILYFPKSIQTSNAVRPYASISGFMVDGLKYPVTNKLELPSATSNITITLLGAALKSGGNFQYQYRLLGTDSSWVSLKASENLVRFTSLPSGNYVFESRVLNEDGIISSSTASIQFSIDQYWFKKWWFILILLLGVIGAGIYFFMLRINVLEKKNLEEKEKVRVLEQMRHSQLSALKAQMNPHFMFNALNSIQEIILMNNKREANMYLGKFADLMRITLDQSNKNAISLEDELKSLLLYLELEALRFETHFQYKIEVEDNIFAPDILIPAMLIQPYVENAIKHGLLHKQGEKQLLVHFKLENEETLVCMIMDNGIGRKRSAEINQLRARKHTSFATGATLRRLELLNYGNDQRITVNFEDLKDERGQDSGTKVLLFIPIVV
jgi:ligand-binding sensor domain-containing protein